MRSGLRLNSSRDIEDRALLLDVDGAAGAEFAGVRRRGRVPVGHREDDVRLVRAREGELDDLLERDRACVTVRGRALTMISNVGRVVMKRSMPGSQIDQVDRLDQPVFAAGDLEENGFALARLSEAVEDRAADDRLAPAQLIVVEGELEVAVGPEGDEALGAALTQVEGLVEPTSSKSPEGRIANRL